MSTIDRMQPRHPRAEWLQRLSSRLDQAPAQPRAALELLWQGGPAAALVGSIEPALAAQLATAGMPLRRRGEGWRLELPSEAGIDPAFAAIAAWLRANGLVAAWRDELLSVTEARGAVVGRIERAAMRRLGMATHAVHLVLSDAHGHVWVQQRAFDKATDPGLWDTAMGGLIAAGETVAQTLERETWEEAGLRTADLQGVAEFGRLTVRRPLAEGYMVEHIHMFEAVAPMELVPVNQDGEVERFECLEGATLIERLHADAFTLEAAMILSTWVARRGSRERDR